MTDIDLGTIVDGRYRVISRLGSGGMADVFLAEDQQLGRNVALKLLHRRFSADPGFVERFRREAQAAAGLQHPNVVSVYDRGEFKDTYYIAMEYLPGRSLKQVIRLEAPLDPVRAIEIAIQILKAARFAHRHGVIHRDLKPHNVIVDDSGHAKVTDFGIARAGASDMTETGSIMGTAQYLSPEQAQGANVGATSDLYSVGVVLYEMLTGRVPFDGESPVTIALKHVAEAPAPLRSINPNVPPDLDQVVLWALNKETGDRPVDADQFISVLTQVRESIIAGRTGEHTASMAALGIGARAPGRSGTVTTPADAATAYRLAAGTQLADVGRNYEDDPPAPGRNGHGGQDGSQQRVWPWIVGILALLLIIGGGTAFYLLERTSTVAVPYVTGLDATTAMQQLRTAGLTPDLEAPVYSNRKVGTVVSQNPGEGVHVASGSTVKLKPSGGPAPVVVPGVVGLTKSAAEHQLAAKKFKFKIHQESSKTITAGNVISMSPAAGQQRPVGTVVTLNVSDGKPQVTVPSVVGEQVGLATTALKGANFQVSITPQVSTEPVGTVLNQDPNGNTKATYGATVVLTVAKAQPTVPIQSWVGGLASDALTALRAQGFVVTETFTNVRFPSKDGIVLHQHPRTGNIKKGSPVTIVVGQYVAPPVTTTTSSSTTTTTTSSSTTTTTTTTTTPTTTTGAPAG